MEIKLKDEKENQSGQNQSSFEEKMQVKLKLKDENLESTQSRNEVENTAPAIIDGPPVKRH